MLAHPQLSFAYAVSSKEHYKIIKFYEVIFFVNKKWNSGWTNFDTMHWQDPYFLSKKSEWALTICYVALLLTIMLLGSHKIDFGGMSYIVFNWVYSAGKNLTRVYCSKNRVNSICKLVIAFLIVLGLAAHADLAPY